MITQFMSFCKPGVTTKDVDNQKYHILGEELSSFKQLLNENAHDMYSRLNILVNEINALGLNQVEDWEINRKILRSLRKPDYDIINSLLQKEDLVKLTPNQVINQIIAHEYSMGMTKKKSKNPPLLQATRVSLPSTHASTNQGGKTHQAQVNKKKRMRKKVMMSQVK